MTSRIAFAVLASTLPLTAVASEKPKAPPPKVEVAFVLDTTGSMGGLIEGAKQKIWSIANQIAKGDPAPDLKIALVAYRDRGDEYVTQDFDLTSDIDKVYANLSSFRADGGGDEPEDVQAALHDAVTKLSWSKDKSALKMIFLVGDAPPHVDYPDEKQMGYETSARLASESGITLNTVQCGATPETTTFWTRIASLGKGGFHAIQQDGGVVVVTTPMDDELAQLNGKLASTVIAYGDAGARAGAESRAKAATAMPAPAAAERASYYGGGAGAPRALDSADLVDAHVDVATVKKDELPPEMRSMNADQRKAYVADKQKERADVESKIADLSKKRQTWIDSHAAPAHDSFDASVMSDVKTQAKAKGLAL